MILWYLDFSFKKIELDDKSPIPFDVFTIPKENGSDDKLYFDVSLLKNSAIAASNKISH